MTRLEGDEGLHHLAEQGVGQTDHPHLRHGGVLHEGALELERADEVASQGDHVVAPTDEVEVAVLVVLHEIAHAYQPATRTAAWPASSWR